MVVEFLLSGLVDASIILFGSIGLSLLYGVKKFANFAHGDLMTLGAYLALILFLLVTVALLRFIRIPDPSAAEQQATGRPLSVIARQPKYLVAVAGAAVGYGVMNFLMTSTPIAMSICGHPYGAAAFVISSHVVGMYLPSFVTGGLIRRGRPGMVQASLRGITTR